MEPPGQVLSTLEKDGGRRWLWPRLARGRFWAARRIVAWALIVIFVALPHLSINGKPVILLDIVHRRFTILGVTFLPTDTILLALGLVGWIVLIFLFTALLGRAWCGWACPQTVYLEFVFRPIERWCDGTTGRGGKPSRPPARWRRWLKHVLYLLVSAGLAHTFLAYFVGVENLRQWVLGSPLEHPVAFMVMAGTTGLMLFDFGYFREQMCTLACPYGRFQSVMLDRRSLIISYDPRRGEPRGKMRRSSDAAGQSLGDCVDCQACVTACPTGIDIRNGLQMECIGCAQCIDACDAVMSKIGRPTGLIRYSSQEAMEGGSARWLRPRVVFYPAILLVIGSLMAYMLARRSAADVTILRSPGIPFAQSEDGRVLNPLRLRITNRGDRPATYEASIVGDDGAQLVMSQNPFVVEPDAQQTVGLLVSLPREAFDKGVHHLTLRVTDDQGTEHQVQCQLVGPLTAEGNDRHDRHDQQDNDGEAG